MRAAADDHHHARADGRRRRSRRDGAPGRGGGPRLPWLDGARGRGRHDRRGGGGGGRGCGCGRGGRCGWRCGRGGPAGGRAGRLRADGGRRVPRVRTLWAMSREGLRNLAIILLLGAVVAFLPGGGDAAAILGAVLGTLILASFVFLAARWYRDHRLALETLGDRHRALLYGAVALVVFAMAGRGRMLDTGAGAVLWMACLLGAGYAGYRVWRHWREYV